MVRQRSAFRGRQDRPQQDRLARSMAYAELSRRYAAEGNAFAAVHAAWAADLCAAKAVLWERAVASSAHPEEQFSAAAQSVSGALAAPAPEERRPRDAAGAVRAVRRALGAALDRKVQHRVTAAFGALDHLEGLALPDDQAGGRTAAARLQGSSVHELSLLRRRGARDCMAVAQAMHDGGRDAEALRMLWQSDWAAFEAYLLDAAMAVGDEFLVTVELRWELARQAATGLSGLSPDLVAAADSIRAMLASAVDPAEVDRLEEHYEPVVHEPVVHEPAV